MKPKTHQHLFGSWAGMAGCQRSWTRRCQEPFCTVMELTARDPYHTHVWKAWRDAGDVADGALYVRACESGTCHETEVRYAFRALKTTSERLRDAENGLRGANETIRNLKSEVEALRAKVGELRSEIVVKQQKLFNAAMRMDGTAGYLASQLQSVQEQNRKLATQLLTARNERDRALGKIHDAQVVLDV